ncbi:MAG: iron-containing alcohol dehydrogenase, partial [Candidatus Nitrosothermus koennekii]
LAKITAVRDWQLARDENGEYFGSYSANLASLSASIIMEEAKDITNYKEFTRTVVEALISSGVAAGIAGSSRPCSGSEHLFSHALEYIAPNKGLHGERCGLGTIMMAKLHGLDWKKIIDTLKNIDAPTTAYEIGITRDEVVKALVIAKDIRPERYTILHKINMDEEKAFELAKSTGII